MKNVTKGIFVGAFMLLSAFGFSQESLSKSPNGALIQKYVSNAEFKLSQQDIQGLTVTDEYYSDGMALTLVYVGQAHQGIPIYNAISTIAVKDGKVFNVASRFVSDVASKVKTTTPAISAMQAIEKVATYFKLGTPVGLRSLKKLSATKQEFSNGNISSREVIPVKLVYVQEEDGSLGLYQDVEVDVIDGIDMFSVRVNATTGEISERNIHNYTISCAFEDHSFGNESTHNHAEHQEVAEKYDAGFEMFKSEANTSMMVDGSSYRVLPFLSDGSTKGYIAPSHGPLEVIREPANLNASPFGWHDTNGRAGAEHTNTRGNNVFAYEDLDNRGRGDSPDGGNNLTFDFPFNDNQQPSRYRPASITNLFYGNNMTHDVWYEYGFNEVAGNFQENNYGKGGRGGDSVNAEGQDGGGINNANMSTQGDGNNPRMQMYLWNRTNPQRDGDFDNGIVVHEYGHGISIRLAGGPSNSGCLRGQEQGGEGWSDWFAIMMTMNNGDKGEDKRGMGTYAIGQGTNGTGIRRKAYSTNFRTNDFTYDDIKTQVAPHGVGSVLCTFLWDLNWAYIDKYGFSDDLYNGDAGNNKVMQLVLDGLKLQPCGAGFVDVRDSLLAADKATTGGKDACLIWSVFARRGLGFSADQGDPGNKGDGREAFDGPSSGIALNTIKDECGSDDVELTITNFTDDPVSSFPYTFRVDGGAEVSRTWTGNIGSCESAAIILDLGQLSQGSHLLEVSTASGDASTTISVNGIGVENEINTFETDDDELIAFNETGNNSLWERGDATGPVLNGTVSGGSKVYGTNLDGNHGNNTTAYLVSQCYDLSNLTSSFIKFDLAYKTEVNFDILYVQYSKDGGEEWEVLGEKGPNWYNSDRTPGAGTDCQNCPGAQWTGTDTTMKEYRYPLNEFDAGGSAEKNMLFRFVYVADRGVVDEGVIIDNFVITTEALSTADVRFEDLSIFPNPTTGVVTIQSSTSLEDARVSVNDIMGRALTNGISVNAVGDNKITVDLSQFATGAYFITVENETRKSTKRIIKD